MKTCSLGCVKEHKVKFGCDGVRKKTIYIDIEKYGYKDLMSDYVFLEDISRNIDTARRLRLDKNTKNDDDDENSSAAVAAGFVVSIVTDAYWLNWQQQRHQFGIKFSNKELMHQVCTHKSFNSADSPTNERLCFLVIELYSTDYFIKEYEDLSADKLNDIVDGYVDVNKDNNKIGIIGMKMGLNKLMYWTPINYKALEESKLQETYLAPSGELKVVGKTLLALVGAIYHDKGALAAKNFIYKNILSVNEEE
ncbi:9736_t:CDS:2 [Entrophospora sp. SA101]|nr:9736_t:CDS:2 [Entrophospora sp. SA101]